MNEVGVSRLSLVSVEVAAEPEQIIPQGFEEYEQKIGQLVSSVVVEVKPEATASNYLVKRRLIAVEDLPLEQPKSPLDVLTDPELEVAGLLALGVANPRIAKKLFMPEDTVAAHVSAIFGKFEVLDRLRAGLAV